MKRIILCVLAAVMCLSAAACGGTPQNGDESGGSANATARPGYKMWTSGRTADTSVPERKTESYQPEEGNAEEFTVANYFSDDMIVPKEKEIVIWGTAPESQNGKIVAAEFKGLKGSAAIANGSWKIVLQGTLPASGEQGHTLTVSGGNGVKEEFKDVLVGDIWIVSGQSNSDLTFFGTVAGTSKDIQELYKEELNAATKEDNIRILRQTNFNLMNDKYKDRMNEPQTDILKGYKWNVAEKKRVVGNSATNSFSMLGYFFAKELYTLNPDVPVGIIMAGCGGAPLSLLASKEANDAFPSTLKDKTMMLGNYLIPECGIYNMFLSPLTNVGIAGMIFYQGETDTLESRDYGDALGIFVKDLRNKFGTNFMFLNTQLTSYGYESGGASLAGGIWDAAPNMRFAQAEVKIDHSIPDYEVIATLDLGWKEGDGDGAHPYYKKEIGQRAAAIAAAKLYGIGEAENVGCPVPAKIEYKKDALEITYDYAGGTLKTPDGGAVKGFEVKTDGVWKPAEVKISGNVISVQNAGNPEGVRYAPELRYADMAKANLCSGTGYPAAAFSVEFK
ncbi:MAG: sialate O-acetylesterase [Clostridia bacterium]